MFYNKTNAIPIAVSASLLLFSIFVFSQTTTSPAAEDNSWLKMSGYKCVWVNDELVDCSPNLITRAGKNMTRDMLTNFNGSSTVGTTVNGTLYLSLSNTGVVSTEDSICPGEITANGLGRALGSMFYVANQSAPAASNYSISYKWTATGTQAVQQTCLSNSSAQNGAILFAEDTFTSVTLNSGDTINITWFIGIT